MNELTLGSLYSGFRLNEIRPLPELSLEMYTFEHEQSGARLIYLKADDDNKVFYVGFRTTPVDSTGVFHILEHSVLCGGTYRWSEIKDTIVRECGWVAPAETDKGLHTSCQIEKCKEHTQFVRFYQMRSTMIPFSALEMAIASSGNALSREDAMAELTSSLGFSLSEVPECAIMREYLQ